jgi:hypothetical protein
MGARPYRGLLSSICLLVVALAPVVATGQPRDAHFGGIGRIVCAEGAERYLPGDYYFCAANKALQAGNPGKARAMYEESAAWGDKRAMFNLGLLLLRGDGLPRDEPLALAWLPWRPSARKTPCSAKCWPVHTRRRARRPVLRRTRSGTA